MAILLESFKIVLLYFIIILLLLCVNGSNDLI